MSAPELIRPHGPSLERPPLAPEATDASAPFALTPTQGALIGDLGGKLRLVGVFLLAAGILAASSSAAATTTIGGMLQAAIALAFYGLIGAGAYGAGRSFRVAATARGGDVAPLMKALGELRKLCALIAWLLIAALLLSGATIALRFLVRP